MAGCGAAAAAAEGRGTVAVTQPEADCITFYRSLFSGGYPKPVGEDFVGLGPEALSVFQQGLASLAVRFLLEQGGVLEGLAFVDGKRSSGHALWRQVRSPLVLLFSRPLFGLLMHLCREDTPPLLPGEYRAGYTVADNVVLLMLAHYFRKQRISRLQAKQGLLELGYLPSLLHFWCATATELPDDPALDHVLFCLRPMLARAWQLGDPAACEMDQHPSAENAWGEVLQRAERRAQAWQIYREHVLSSGRYELFDPMCAAYAAQFAEPGSSSQLIAALERLGRFSGEGDRQRAYRAVLAGYQWIEELDRLHARAMNASPYDDDYGQVRVLLACSERIGEQARAEARTLLSALKFEA
jgi:hypothetical protein